jgi:hypothetical protein
MKIQGNKIGPTWPGQYTKTLAPVRVMIAFFTLRPVMILLHRMTQSNAAGISGVFIGYTK